MKGLWVKGQAGPGSSEPRLREVCPGGGDSCARSGVMAPSGMSVRLQVGSITLANGWSVVRPVGFSAGVSFTGQNAPLEFSTTRIVRIMMVRSPVRDQFST